MAIKKCVNRVISLAYLRIIKMQMQKVIGTRTKTKSCKQGYSWTTLFFSFLVPLLRGMPASYIAKVWIFGIFTLALKSMMTIMSI